MSVYLLGNSVVFWFDAGGRTTIPYTITNIGQYAKYPVEIYPRAMQIGLLFLVPYAFIGVIPAEILRGTFSRTGCAGGRQRMLFSAREGGILPGHQAL